MENTELLKLVLNKQRIAYSWPYCFNTGCQLQAECLRYQAALVLDSSVTSGTAVFPSVDLHGKCPLFKPIRSIRTAWGFERLFDNVRTPDAPTLRRMLKDLLNGNGNYYRYHHGTRRLSPDQQKSIRQLFARMGYDNIEFGHYQDEIEL